MLQAKLHCIEATSDMPLGVLSNTIILFCSSLNLKILPFLELWCAAHQGTSQILSQTGKLIQQA